MSGQLQSADGSHTCWPDARAAWQLLCYPSLSAAAVHSGRLKNE